MTLPAEVERTSEILRLRNRAEKMWSARCRCVMETYILGTRRRFSHILIDCYTTSPLEKARG